MTATDNQLNFKMNYSLPIWMPHAYIIIDEPIHETGKCMGVSKAIQAFLFMYSKKPDLYTSYGTF